MPAIQTHTDAPPGSVIRRDLQGEIDYLDSFSVEIDAGNEEAIDLLTVRVLTSIPKWAGGLAKLRDLLVRPLGLQTNLVLQNHELRDDLYFGIGDKVVLFPVIDRTESEIVLGEDDRHLYFRLSVLAAPGAGTRQTVYVTTLVQFHNRFGRLYFLPVQPFHKLIVRSLLARFAKSLGR